MSKEMLFVPVPLEDFREILQNILRQEIAAIPTPQVVPPVTHSDQLLTRRAAAKYLGVSLPTLHKYTQDGKITAYRVGSAGVRYRQSDLDNSLRLMYAHKKGGVS